MLPGHSIQNRVAEKGYNTHFMESPLLLQELNEAGDLPMQLHNHPVCQINKLREQRKNFSRGSNHSLNARMELREETGIL